MQRKCFQQLCAMAVVALAGTGAARADFLIEVGDLELQPGATGFVDVMISSPSSAGFASYNFEFQITTGGSTRLEFVNPQPTGYLFDPDYVLAGDSVGFSGSVQSWDADNDTYFGSDWTASSTNVFVTDPQLLVRLEVTAATSSAPIVGDQFTIDVVPAGTYLLDDNFDIPPYASTAGTVTMVVAAVPEPSSLALLTAGLATVGLCRRRRLRLRRTTA